MEFVFIHMFGAILKCLQMLHITIDVPVEGNILTFVHMWFTDLATISQIAEPDYRSQRPGARRRFAFYANHKVQA